MKETTVKTKGLNLRKRNSRKPARWILLGMFFASAITGIFLHVAGHGHNHELWHDWAVAHVVTSLLWLIGTAIHVKRHRIWYKQLFTNGIGRKSKLTVLLTAVFLFVAVTGIILLVGVEGANSDLGLWHYKLGLALIAVSVMHIWGRRKCFR